MAGDIRLTADFIQGVAAATPYPVYDFWVGDGGV